MVTQPPILPARVTQLSVSRRGKRLLGPIDWEIGATGLTVVIGPNGAGKTSLLQAVHGLAKTSAGAVHWAAPDPEVRAAQAFVFQSPVILRRTVLDNVAYPLRLRGVARRDARARATEWLEKIGLAGAAGQRARMLSGGERQKMALARALIGAPQLLFLDEPCSNLDGASTREIEALLSSARDGGLRIIMATHDMGQARRLADDVVLLHRGQVVETGPAKPFFDAPATEAARAFLRGDILE